MANFSSRLKELRKEKGVLQKDMADYLGITVRAYQHYEGDTRYPDFHGILKLADYFDVTIDYLVGRSDEKK